MQESDAIFQEIEESFENLRRATEYRDYGSFNALLERQRGLLRSAPASHPRTRALALRGRELVDWAITMIKIQRAGYARSLAAILTSKHLDSSYTDTKPKRADVISIRA